MLTKALSSKANIKQFSGADLPFNPKQPVIQKYEATSSDGQTVINLPFSVDTNAAENFDLFVNGSLLREGSDHDFQFTGVDVHGLSAQVTLNNALIANLNIVAIKRGLKKESEFLQDNRFVDLYEAMSKGFQGYTDTSTLITATSGSPTASQFYSSILNRSPIPDLSQDLKARMGVERIRILSIFPIDRESGSSGEVVWGTVNDTHNQIRFVGNWKNSTTDYGTFAESQSTNDYIEVVFYGTGLNFLMSNPGSKDIRATVNNGAEGSNLILSTPSGVISGQNFWPNIIIPVVSGLALGRHTVKIRHADALQNYIGGFEILNESSSVRINPGTSYVQGKKLTLSAASVLAYNTGVTGTKGGRVLVYQKADGSIGSAFQAVSASQLTLASTNHVDEEIIKVSYWREFGSGRGDDFSTLTSSFPSNRTGVLEDGSTWLLGHSTGSFSPRANTMAGYDALDISAGGTGGAITFTFIGTGLDIIGVDENTGTGPSVVIDGTSAGNFPGSGQASVARLFNVCSGLPYGTHTVKITRVDRGWGAIKFIVYGPKKPTLPAGAVELADYNVLANFSGMSTVTTGFVSTGVIRKNSSREIFYSGGSWVNSGVNPASFHGGYNINAPATAGHFLEYYFFGTGIEYHGYFGGNFSYNWTVTVDGSSNLTGLATMHTAATGVSFTASTGTVSGSVNNGGNNVTIRVNGLSLGWHKIRITQNGGAADGLYSDGFSVITPIHSPFSNAYQDTLAVSAIGSCSLGDLRKFNPVFNLTKSLPNWAQTLDVGISNFTTTSTSFVPVPRLKTVIKTKGGPLRISYSVALEGTSTAARVRVFINGVDVERASAQRGGTPGETTSRTFVVPVEAGVHVVQVYIQASSGATVTVYSDSVQGSYLLAEEMK
jgi:hypothetical protein